MTAQETAKARRRVEAERRRAEALRANLRRRKGPSSSRDAGRAVEGAAAERPDNREA